MRSNASTMVKTYFLLPTGFDLGSYETTVSTTSTVMVELAVVVA